MIRLNKNFKVLFLLQILLIYLIICTKSFADNPKASDSLIVLGINEAPVKIKIFSSLTCPHCANFHINVVSEIKKKYVDSGKVQLIFIDFPLDQNALNASIILHCLEQEKQLTFLDNIYKNQSEWTSGSDLNEINNNLKEIVKILGISSDEFDKCLNNEIITDKILNDRINGHQKYSIEATPTIIINEQKFDASINLKNIEKKIEKLI